MIAGAPALSSQLESLRTAVTTNKAAAEAANEAARTTWASMSEDLPKMVGAIQSRVDILSKAKRLPKGMDAAGLAAAKSGLDEIKSVWAEATAAASSGNAVEAVTRAEAVKAKGMEVMQALGMSVGG